MASSFSWVSRRPAWRTSSGYIPAASGGDAALDTWMRTAATWAARWQLDEPGTAASAAIAPAGTPAAIRVRASPNAALT